MTRILIIDAEAQTRRFLRAGFEFHGFEVFEAENVARGLMAATINEPDLIILDPILPDKDGVEVLLRVRSCSNIPIIVLSIESHVREIVRLLKLGADGYVVKPFGFSELLARSEAALRRDLRSVDREPIVRAGPLAVDLASRLVTLEGKRVLLTRKEYALLHILTTNAGLVVTHEQLVKDIWDNRVKNIQYLRILVRKLRQKLEIDPTAPRLILSKSGVGYRLDLGSTGAMASQ